MHCVDDTMKIPEFWNKLRDIEDVLDQLKFQKLSTFMTDLTVLTNFLQS